MVSSLLTCESSNDGVWILYLKRMLCIALPATGILADEMGLGMYMIVATVRGTALFTTILFFEFNPSLLREEPAKCDHVRQVARSPFWGFGRQARHYKRFPFLPTCEKVAAYEVRKH